jgi:hypothetical protein
LNSKSHRFYYGWVIVGVSFITLFFALGVRFSFGVFYAAILGGYGLGGALGAYVGGFFYDTMGSYFVPFVLSLALTSLGILGIWMAAPRHRSALINKTVQANAPAVESEP